MFRLEEKLDREHAVSDENHDNIYCNFLLVHAVGLVINEETPLWGYKNTIITLLFVQ